MIHGQLAKSMCRKLRQYTALLFVVSECALCLVLKGTHTLQNYFDDDESRDGPQRLKEG